MASGTLSYITPSSDVTNHIDIKQSTASPVSKDIGNRTIQKKVVSKTIKYPFFTTNENAVWAGNNALRIGSYPLAQVSFPCNRRLFKYQVGDVFKFSYSKYGISSMVLRVIRIEEDELSSEKIVVTAQEDIYSAKRLIVQQRILTDHAAPDTVYTVDPLTKEDVVENPYLASSNTVCTPIAVRNSDLIEGFDVHISVDGGTSYNYVGRVHNLIPYGTLVGTYSGDTYTIDTINGFTINFESGVDQINSITWATTFPSTINRALLGSEIISFKDITPISGTQYKIENIAIGEYVVTAEKARYDTGNISVVIQAGQITEADFFLTEVDTSTPPTTGMIEGTVRDAQTGASISGAVLSTDPTTDVVTSSGDGSYSFENITPGEYTISIAKTGYQNASISVTVTAGKTSRADIVLIQSYGSISGIVKDATTELPIQGVNIQTDPATSSVTTDSDGRYKISGITPGSFTVKASKAGYADAEIPVVVTAGNETAADIPMQPGK